MVSSDSIVAVASGGNRLYLFNQLRKEAPPLQIMMDESISSLQTVQDQGKKMIMVGLADQSILLYTETGTPLWKYKSRNSIFPKPFVKDGLAWIDQGNDVVAISLKTGKVERKFSTPGGAGTPFIMNKTLFSASPKRLLYGFSL
jgi:outer membrane protein assembly factor BamB